MKIAILDLSLEDLRDALRDYAEKHAKSQPSVVRIVSYDRVRITVDLHPGGCVESFEDFRHRMD